MIREFYLKNARGDRVELQGVKEGVQMLNPQGLGVTFNHEFDYNDGNFTLLNSEVEQGNVSGSILVGLGELSPYKEFTEFTKFANYVPLVLEYTIDGDTYQRDCYIDSLSKSEIVTGDILIEQLSLVTTTPYYKDTAQAYVENPPIDGIAGKVYAMVEFPPSTHYAIPPNEYLRGDTLSYGEDMYAAHYNINHYEDGSNYAREGSDTIILVAIRSNQTFDLDDWIVYSAPSVKHYDYIYEHTYGESEIINHNIAYHLSDYTYDTDISAENGIYNIHNESVYMGVSETSPMIVTVYGPCTNPYWEIIQDSKMLQSDGYLLEVPENHRLEVSSYPQNLYCKLISLDGVESSVYQQQDISRSNFVTAPLGSSKIVFGNVKNVRISVREESIVV